MSYTYYQAKNPTTININDEHVTESELPERLLELNNKTKNITYEEEGDKTIIANTTETGNLKVTYDTDTYTLSVGSHADFNGSVLFSATVNGYNIENELSKLQFMSTADDLTEVSGPFRANNLVGITYDDDLNTTFFSGNVSSPNISTLEDNLANLLGIIGGVTGFSGNLQADDFVTTSGTLNTFINNTQNIIRVPSTPEGDPSYTEIDGTSFQTTLARISNIEGTLTKVSYDPIGELTTISGKLTVNGNITASNLTGISYNSNLQLQGTDYCSATILNQHIYIELTAMTYAPHLGLRIHKTNLSNGQELMLQVGKDSTRAISFVYKHYDTIANSQYRLDFAGKSAYICNYGATSKTEHEIRGNLKVYGSVTENASRTITHYTMYEGDLQPGFFVESTGQIFRNGETSYENCMVTVRQATTFSNNIIGVCTEIINEEITDDYGNVNQPAGKYCKFATHGDSLIKCESATYTCGDIIVPSLNGYGKKGSSTDVLNCMLSMTPRLKVTSVDTDEIDPQCVVGFITV